VIDGVSDGGAVDPVQVKVLGPMELKRGDSLIAFAGPGQQALLARLVLELGRAVPLDRLVDTVWDTRPPATARNKIQVYVSALRRVLAQPSRRGGGPILTVGSGYLLSGDGIDLDLSEFDKATASGRTAFESGQPAVASELFASALALWRGPAFADVTSPAIRATAAALEERRLLTVEAKAEADLASGRSEIVVAELGMLLADLPLRERLRGLLMVALYRLGCRADALALYRKGNRIMTSELGLEPSSQLRLLHQHILADDVGLLRAVPAWPRHTDP
jgi:DNA-binding SARP family transcriptional activator